MVTENINIDVRPGGIPIVIHVTQYEVGLRQFVFTPYTSNGTQTVVAGSATLEGTKPDGYAFQQACQMIDGVITYTLQEQLCAVEGRVWSRLVIRDASGGMIGYTAIVWVVGRAGVADDAVMSDSDISALQQFLDEFGTIDAYRGALNGALAAVGGPLVAATASAMTDTTKVYVYTGSESGYTEGHWYYWNGSAWTDGGVYQSTGINTDKTLTVEDMAADAKATGDQITELKNDFNNFVDNDIIENTINCGWVQNRAMIADGVLTEVESDKFCHTDFILMSENATIEVDSAYKIYGFSVASNSFGSNAGGFTSAWSTGTVPYVFNSSAPYAVICIMKADNTAITPSEAQSAVKFYTTSHSAFALKETVSSLNESVVSLQTASATTTENISVLSDYVETGEKEIAGDPITPAWVQGNPVVNTTNKTVTISADNKVCYEYLPISYGNTYYLNIASGFRIFAYALDTNESTFTKIGLVTDWAGGDTTKTYTPPIQSYRYLLIKIIKSDNTALTPQEAVNGLSVYENTVSTIEYLYEDNLDKQSVKAVQNKAIAKWDIEINTFKPYAERGQILYEGDTKVDSGHIVNAVAYDDGVIIACRSDGKVVRIGYDGAEETLLTISGSNMDWRLCWMDSNENVYVSPHASYGVLGVADRGLYKLAKGASSFTKVIALYNPSSSVTTENENNNDTIWTMCEDSKGNLYAGVYAHTIRANPAIYKSTDGGNTWTYVFNFNTAGLTSDGRHIHTIIYNQWQDALYCIVGEINTIFKSTDGINWTDLRVELNAKGSAMCATPFGVLIGSDSAYNCEIDILFNDDTTHKTVFSGWANTIFAIRRSDLTGFLYAFTKVDSSVNSDSVFPPIASITDSSVLNTWKNTSGHNVLSWTNYYNSVIDKYPEDAIRPQHCSILVSRDGGARWEVLKKWSLTVNPNNGNNYIDGFWTTGFFKNGECLTGRMESNAFVNPIVISEGKHKYVSGGCDLSGEIMVRTNADPVVTVL